MSANSESDPLNPTMRLDEFRDSFIPPDMSFEKVHDLGVRALHERMAIAEKCNTLIAESRALLDRIDRLLSKR